MHGALGREPQPVALRRLARLGEPASRPLRRRLELYPALRFKLDPTSSGTSRLIAELVATGASTRSTSRACTTARSSTSPPTRCSTARRRGVSGRVDRGPGAHAGDRRRARAAPRALLLGRADPFDRRTSRRCLSRRGCSTQALAARLAARLSTSTTMRRARHRQLRRRPVRAGLGRGQIQYLASLFHAGRAERCRAGWLQLCPSRWWASSRARSTRGRMRWASGASSAPALAILSTGKGFPWAIC